MLQSRAEDFYQEQNCTVVLSDFCSRVPTEGMVYSYVCILAESMKMQYVNYSALSSQLWDPSAEF